MTSEVSHTNHPARTPKVRWLARVLLVAAVVSLGVAAVYPSLSGRSASPTFSLEGARNAVMQARRAGASRLAPAALKEAEDSLQAALLEHRIQETRFVIFRNFAAAREAFQKTEEKGRRAVEEANRKRIDARAGAEEALARAGQDVSGSDAFADAMHLGILERTMLGRSKVALAEARSLFAQDAYALATDRATAASSQARTVTQRAVAAASRFTDSKLVADWRRMVDETVDWSRRTGRVAVVVYKENHRLTVYDSGKPIRTYAADMGYKSINDKLHAGDSATPEGRYSIAAKKGRSTYYKALLLDYPNAEDRANFDRLRRSGQIPLRATLGGMIEIHGEGGRGKDWTKGCVALANADIDTLFPKVDVGTPVTIVGSDGNGGTFTQLVRQSAQAEQSR
jgi:L,D-peptidoglycan transpeptidase YkuD (ErfK/YbiS/YcfS/YnhG family)